MMKRLFVLLFCLVNFISFSNAASKKISGEYYVELQSDRINSVKGTNTNSKKVTNTFIEAKSQINLNLKDYLDINTSWSLHQVKSSLENQGGFFKNEAIILEGLNLKFSNDEAELIIGKYNPNFALLWSKKLNSSIWGTDYAEEYQLVGKLGAKINAKINLEDYGNHIITVSSFFNDETGLEDTIITKSERGNGNIGQAGNSRGLSSYSLNIFGNNFYDYEGLFYNLSYQNVSPGNSSQKKDDQNGYSLTFGIDKYMLYNLKILPVIEYVKINNFNSVNYRFGPDFGDSQLPGNYEYLNMLLTLGYQSWAINLNRLTKDISTEIEKYKSNQNEISIAYKFANNLNFALGRKSSKNINDEQIVTFGAKLSLQRKF